MIHIALVTTTIGAALLLALVMLAFRRHSMSTEDTALTDLVAGIFWLAAAMFLRSAWWDAAQSLVGREAFIGLYGGGLPWPNIIFNSMIVLAAWRLLRGFWLMIPEPERGHYNFLTAAFYPRRVWGRITRGKE